MISTNPYKGTKDFYPTDQLIQNYIFEKWKKVATSYSFEEYQTPIIEPSEIYEAKSGEDVGKKELFTFTDLADRKLCLRPEMTPSVTRIVAAKYKELPKPIKYFSIGSFYRNERPQKGRNREFWQINIDIFGEKGIYADIEILLLALNIMKEFKAPEGSYSLFVSHRKLLDDFFNSLGLSSSSKINVIRIIDKYEKLSTPVFHEELSKFVNENDIKTIEKFLSLNLEELLEVFPEIKDSEGFLELQKITEILEKLGFKNQISFKPSLVRGFDYYDGLVFEMFDNNPDNNRSLFGGGRYNGLAGIFGQNNFPAVGFAVGNETFRIFLENWNLIPPAKMLLGKIQLSIFAVKNSADNSKNESLLNEVLIISNEIRSLCHNVSLDTILEPKSPSAGLDYISNKNYDYAILIGEEEILNQKLTIKEMQTGSQKSLTLHELITFLKQLPHEIY